MLPGATVSGTDINNNTAEEGAGIYADNENASKALRAHVVSSTITDNTATENAGGILFEDGAALFQSGGAVPLCPGHGAAGADGAGTDS